MKTKDITAKEYFRSAERVADLINSYVFSGKPFVCADDVHEAD